VRFSTPKVEAFLRRVIEVRAAWLVEKYGFKGCVVINLFVATHDIVASPDSGFSGRIAGAAALDMRTEQRESGSTYYLGAMHAGTHITHPDVTVDRRGNGLGWQQEEWLEFLVELTVTHARVLGAEALESAAAAAGDVHTKTRIMRKSKPILCLYYLEWLVL
jgi:hypothetical protein